MALQVGGVWAVRAILAADPGLAVLDRREVAAATSARRGWPCRPGKGQAMPSVPLTLGFVVLDCWEGGG